MWGDEFSGTTIDTNKWGYNVADSKMSGYSDLRLLSTEEAIGISKYDEDKGSVDHSYLRLTALKKNINGVDSYFAPASVHTQGRMEFTYGYAEIRAKVPFQKGVWPCFWAQGTTLLGGKKCSDYYVEVDMFEVFGDEKTLFSNIHLWYQDRTHKTSRDDQTSVDKWFDGTDDHAFADNSAATEWHTYGFEWTEKKIKMYVDNRCFRTYNITDAEDMFGASDSNTVMSGFHDPLYIVLNMHLFTEGTTFESRKGDILEVEDFNSVDYMIDYFRLYQTDNNNNNSIRTRY